MLKKSLQDSWSFFKNHIVALSLIVLPIAAPVEIFNALYLYFATSEENVLSEQILPMAIYFMAYPVYSVAVVFYITSIISGEGGRDTRTLWRLGIKYWAQYFILTFIIGIAVTFGLMLLIVPGIILMARYAFAEFDLLLNKSKPLEAIRNSWFLAKNYMWVILGGYVFITVVLFLPSYLISSIFDETSISYWVIDTVLNMAYSVLAVMYTIFAFRVYELAEVQHNQSLNQDTP